MSKLVQNPVFHELKKQASFFIKEKIKTARLAVTDVTEEELLTEEVTGSTAQSLIDARSMAVITRASFEVDQFQRIVRILRQRMVTFDRREWRGIYNTLSMLNHLLINGPLSIFNEFQHERVIIEDAIINTEWIDERGFDCGVKVRNIADKVLRLLEDDMFLKDERERTRKQSVGRITGFGSSSFVIHSETNRGRGSSFLSVDHQSCENDCIADDHPFVENEHNTAQLLLSSSI
ncbi:hypothetical protein CARUB_v10011520mg [Capsella rubella]|uniref:ENTH domain-containing protein n=1 Tax=Capsella rubella TaxID=81985 RepID=R0IPC8_9BRAS|nr:clathrin interactor 1 [Capsella rubella]EOA38993.1 hypothetical protein CARUB_v10011520mg [Capsella rubella]